MPDFFVNPQLDRTGEYPADLKEILSVRGARAAREQISKWAGYRPTPLRSLGALAMRTRVGEVLYKDEGKRFELKSFKALGGAYAVDRLVAARGSADGLVVTCATDGNHGRAVAWGARRAGVKAVIFVHEGVSEGRAEAIRSFGAEVIRAGAHYDASVRASAEAAQQNGWQIVSDTAWPGYETVPRDVMQGYAVLAMEAEEQGARPTHVFVQGGVGGIAAAVLSYRWERYGKDRPKLIVVEPDNAACLLGSAVAGRLSIADGSLETVMAGLACGEPSTLAWKILEKGADAFMAVTDQEAIAAMQLLAGMHIVGGESGVAGLAGFLKVAANPVWRKAIGLDSSSSVLLYGTEGATDPVVYRDLVGQSADDVEAGA